MKKILITGSTDGIGKLVAIKLAKDGHHIYVHGRNSKKLSDTIAEIKNNSSNENVSGFVADFSDLGEVKSMAAEIKDQLSNLDILINNAGVFKSPVSLSKAGIDIRLVVNYLAPYLLTKELIPLIIKSEQPSIINLSSAAQAPVLLDAIMTNQDLSAQDAYAQSKLALTMWSFDLARNEKDISIIAVNPGSLLNTKMADEAYGQHWSPADKGVDILYDLASNTEYDGISGKYFDNDKGEFAQAHDDAYNDKKVQDLLTATKQVIETVFNS